MLLYNIPAALLAQRVHVLPAAPLHTPRGAGLSPRQIWSAFVCRQKKRKNRSFIFRKYQKLKHLLYSVTDWSYLRVVGRSPEYLSSGLAGLSGSWSPSLCTVWSVSVMVEKCLCSVVSESEQGRRQQQHGQYRRWRKARTVCKPEAAGWVPNISASCEICMDESEKTPHRREL